MLSIKEEQEIELEIMKEIHDFCVNNNLRYSLAYGTLIGAVRHQGFIPWDNDIDIMMPRNDYERFIELSKNGFSKLYIKHYNNDEKYHYHCIRVCDSNTKTYVPYIIEQPEKMGIWVDIFPIDGYCDNLIPFLIQRFQLFLYKIVFKSLIYISNSKIKNAFKGMVRLVCNNNNNRIIRKIDKISQRYKFDDCEKCNYVFGDKVVPFDRNKFDQLIKYKFDKYEFFGIQNYDEFLTAIYGNYMELPPENKRIVHLIEAEYTK